LLGYDYLILSNSVIYLHKLYLLTRDYVEGNWRRIFFT